MNFPPVWSVLKPTNISLHENSNFITWKYNPLFLRWTRDVAVYKKDY